MDAHDTMSGFGDLEFEMINYIYIGVIAVTLLYTMYIYKNTQQLEEETGVELIDINSYFYSDTYVKESKKRKIWIHIPFEKNSRKWSNFGSRTSTNLN